MRNTERRATRADFAAAQAAALIERQPRMFIHWEGGTRPMPRELWLLFLIESGLATLKEKA